MDARDLTREIAQRTGLNEDDVATVLRTVNLIVREKLAYYESVVLPGMMKIDCRYTKKYGWKLHIAPYRELSREVGASVVRTTEPKSRDHQ